MSAASLSHAAMKQLKASIVTGFRNKAIDLKEFVLQGVRVISNDTKKIGLMGWIRQEMDRQNPLHPPTATLWKYFKVLTYYENCGVGCELCVILWSSSTSFWHVYVLEMGVLFVKVAHRQFFKRSVTYFKRSVT